MAELLMGNEAIALGAIRAGVQVVSGYPGTPSSEILETISKENPGDIYVEWAPNEKVGFEVAAGAAVAGKRSMVTMKQVGLNVAADPLMSLSILGIDGAMVIVVADDPGPISSQNEQDTRHFAKYAKLPMFDPSTPEEAYQMVGEAFALSEKYKVPVFLRPVTRVCHACASVDLADPLPTAEERRFIRSSKWVVFPRQAYLGHIRQEEILPLVKADFDEYPGNFSLGHGRKGILTNSICYAYTREALGIIGATEEEYTLFRLATPFPLPEERLVAFLQGVDEVLVVEELDAYAEEQLLFLCGRHQIKCKITGKLSHDFPFAGEYTTQLVGEVLANYLDKTAPAPTTFPDMPPLAIRPPVLCAGCPHRASFYAVKEAMRGQDAIFTGDIGCYTLGNAMPLDMVDTCLCMGGGITLAQGIKRVQPETTLFGFSGDSTFFHSGITGAVNAVFNKTKMVLVILDNSTTAMTGQQPNPGTGLTMMRTLAEKISIQAILEAIGVKEIFVQDPFQKAEAIQTVRKAAAYDGVSAIIFKSPCIVVAQRKPALTLNQETCIYCRTCVDEIGCPAISKDPHKEEALVIDQALCFGCDLCAQICPTGTIGGVL